MAVPIKGPVHGVATITAKKPVMKLDCEGSLLIRFVNDVGSCILSKRFRKIMKNKKSKNRLKPMD